jgi:hypothetical protein
MTGGNEPESIVARMREYLRTVDLQWLAAFEAVPDAALYAADREADPAREHAGVKKPRR